MLVVFHQSRSSGDQQINGTAREPVNGSYRDKAGPRLAAGRRSSAPGALERVRVAIT